MPRIPAIDPECCIGCEVCTQLCPQVFRMQDDQPGHAGHAHEKAIVHNPAGAAEEQIETAMDSCPAACIYWA